MQIKVELKGATLDAQGIESVHVESVIDSFFGTLGYTKQQYREIQRAYDEVSAFITPEVVNTRLEEVGEEIQKKKESKQTNNIEKSITKTIEEHWEDLAVIKPEPIKIDIPVNVTGKPKQLPLIGSKEPIGTIGEIARLSVLQKGEEVVQEDPAHWKTGIKVREGTNLFQTYYWCDNCGNRGKRFIAKGVKKVHCHACNERMIVEPATFDFDENGVPFQDKFQNYYIARELVNTPNEEGDKTE